MSNLTLRNDLIRISVLEEEIEYLRLRTLIRPSATGHIYTAISVLEDRIKELKQ